MRDYVIITDSCCDLDDQARRSLDIECIPFTVTYDGGEFAATLDWSAFSPKQYYDMMRQGTQFKSSQINSETYYSEFERLIKDGYDVLSLSTSSGLSGSINSSLIARKSILENYPDANVVCVDCLRSSLGQGLIVEEVARLKKEGMSITEAAQWVEQNHKRMNQIGTVDDLKYLRRAGRVSGSAAVMGEMFKIKPLLISNTKGQNVSIGKAIGRNASIRKCVAFVKENIKDAKKQTIGVVHADCLEDAEKVRDLIKDEIGCKDVYINYVGPTIGASVGPGMLGIYFFGNEVTR